MITNFKMYLKSKYPLKTNSEIKDMLQAKMNGTIFEEEATDIINYMYNQDDAEFLFVKLKRFLKHPKKPLVEP